jgi:hypothetical protein
MQGLGKELNCDSESSKYTAILCVHDWSKDMAPSIVTILHDAFKKVVAGPEFLEAMKAQELALPYQAPEDQTTPSFMTMTGMKRS